MNKKNAFFAVAAAAAVLGANVAMPDFGPQFGVFQTPLGPSRGRFKKNQRAQRKLAAKRRAKASRR